MFVRIILFVFIIIIQSRTECYSVQKIDVLDRPPHIDGSGLSWVKLDGGEWLGGEIISIADGLKFRSKNLGILQLELEKVDCIYSTGDLSFLNLDKAQLAGFRIFKNGLVRISDTANPDTNQLQYRSRDYSKKWGVKGGVGLNFVKGASEQIDYNLKVRIRRLDEESRFIAQYLAFIAKEDNILTEGNRRFTSHYDHIYSENIYFRLIDGSYFTDRFQNIDYRLSLGSGIGYSLIDTSEAEWGIVLGLSYQINEFDSVQAGEPTREETPAVTITTDFDKALTSNIDLSLKYNFSLLSSGAGSFQQQLASVLAINVSKYLSFNTSFYWDRTEAPTLDEDGVAPDKDDFRLVFGIGGQY